MNMMFDLFDLIFPVMFLLIFGMILFTFISGIRTWNKNNNSPRLTVEASLFITFRNFCSDFFAHFLTLLQAVFSAERFQALPRQNLPQRQPETAADRKLQTGLPPL